MDTVCENLKWIFSGIGVTIIMALISCIFKKKKKDKDEGSSDVNIIDSEKVLIKNTKNTSVDVKSSKNIKIEDIKNE